MPYFVYILRDSSNNLYIGQTNNLESRVKIHQKKDWKAAKFTKDNNDFRLVYYETYSARIEAMKREKQLKGWARGKKEALIEGNVTKLEELSKPRKIKYNYSMPGEKTSDPQDEQLTQVDEHNNVIGSISRGMAHETPGVYYRTIYVLVKDKKGKVLIQKRSPTKDLFPNCWDLSVGGHVNFGERYPETAVRELREELGLNIVEKDIVLKGEVLVRLPKSREYFNIFEHTLKPNESVAALEKEVSDTQWMSIKDIKKSMANKSLQWYARPEQVIAALY